MNRDLNQTNLGCRLSLMGTPAVSIDGEPRPVGSRKGMALLAYLATRVNEPVGRAHLAGLLWGDSPDGQARVNLRQTLSQLRRLFADLPTDPLRTPFDQVVLHADGLDIDVRALLDDTAAAVGEDVLGREFLEGLNIKAPEFNDWLTAMRADLRGRQCRMLERMAEAAAEARDLNRAIGHLSRLLMIDPLNEAGHRRLMRLFVAQGRRDAALAQFEACREVLERELGVQPESETLDLVRAIRDQRRLPSRETEPVDQVPTLTVLVGLQDPDRHRQLAEGFALSGERARAVTPGLVSLAIDEPERAGRLAETILGDEPAARVMIVAGRELESAIVHMGDEDDPAPGQVVLSRAAHQLCRYVVKHQLVPRPASAARDLASHELAGALRPNRFNPGGVVDKPRSLRQPDLSIAVLPFADLSPDGLEMGLGDSLTEEIAARLSRYRGLMVTAPTAAYEIRDRELDRDQAGEILGVKYAINGRVMRIGERLRLSVALIDTGTRRRVFADQYDRPFEDVFALQDDLSASIASRMTRRAELAEMRRAERLPTENMTAFDYYLRGMAAYRRAGISVDNARLAFDLFDQAIKDDPGFARAYAWRICAVSWYAPEYYLGDGPGMAEMREALALDEDDAEVQRIAGALLLYRREFEPAKFHHERAMELNPSDAYLIARASIFWTYTGDPERGLDMIEKAKMLDPFMPAWCVEEHGVALYALDRFEDAVAAFQRINIPTPRSAAYTAAAQMALGDSAAARATLANAPAQPPGLALDRFLSREYFRNPAQMDLLRARLEKAGLR